MLVCSAQNNNAKRVKVERFAVFTNDLEWTQTMRGKHGKLWRNGLVILGLVGLGISGGTLAALISGASSFGFHSEAWAAQRRAAQGHHSERAALGRPAFAQFHWGLPEEDGMDWWLNRLSSSSTRAGLEHVDQLSPGVAAQHEGGTLSDPHFFMAGTSERSTSQLMSALMGLFPNGRLVVPSPRPASSSFVDPPADPNAPQLNQPVAAPGHPPVLAASAAEPSLFALLLAGALGFCWLQRPRGWFRPATRPSVDIPA
jgi:hypothetical protein